MSLGAVLSGCGTSKQIVGTKEPEPVAISNSFAEAHRPQFHFTPPSGWMNDPNGMVYHDGEYHLFYQYNPDSTVWGPMHWGHAVSKDMVRWEHLPIGLYPDSLGTIFSGSAVVDVNNTSGLGTKENPPMVAIYTSAGKTQQQSIAFSVDRGRSWAKYAANPVLSNPGIPDFRDPKVMWHEQGQKWVMALAVADHISFYSSKDLKEWKHESSFGSNIGAHGGVWECPDLFKLPVEGTNQEKWVLLVSINPGGPNGGSATQYFVGEFDGNKFVLDDQFQQALSKKEPVPTGTTFADFEGSNYDTWKVEGDAFGTGPVTGAIGNQQKVSGFAGRGVVNSFRNGDATTGKLISPEFTVDAEFINLLVGGGKHPKGTAVNLIVENEVVRTATGNNSEALNWIAWDTKELKGKKGRIEIIDNEKGGWGHILVDQIMLAAKPAKEIKEGIWLDYGRDNYAGVSWSGVPEEDGRRLFMGWMSNWEYANVVPTGNWRSAMTVARTLTLASTPEGIRLVSKPVKELQRIYGETFPLQEKTVSGALNISEQVPFKATTYDLHLALEPVAKKSDFAIELSNDLDQKLVEGYDVRRNEYYIDRTNAGRHDFSDGFAGIHWAPRMTDEADYDLRLLVDVASVELFADDGKTVMTEIFFLDEKFSKIRLLTPNGTYKLKAGKVINVKSIFEQGKIN
ncbi:glycoside hydrolase family 32 protein [Pontibacter sp. CAU 1760]